MDYVYGDILTINGFKKGFIKYTGPEIIEICFSKPKNKPKKKGIIIPTLINSHTHIGDYFIKKTKINIPKNLDELVKPPDGIKHQLLESTSDKVIIDGMKSPHGGRNYRKEYMATSAASGELFFSKGEKISFTALRGKPDELADLEWLQNAAPFDDCIIAIDANRNSFILIDPDKKHYDMIPFDPNWAVQDIAEVGDDTTKQLVQELKDML